MARRLLLLSGLATVGVVIHHATSWVVTATVWWADRYSLTQVPDYSWLGTRGYFGVRILDQLMIFPVPAFLFVSGYFVSLTAGRTGSRLTWKMILTRCQWLVIPYLVWAVIILGMRWVDGTVYGAWEILRKLLNGGVSGPFYFVPMLISLYLLSFWLVPLARTRPAATLSVSVALALAVTLLRYPLVLQPGEQVLPRLLQLASNWNLPKYAPWFIVGIVAESNLEGFRSILQRFRRPIVGGAVILGVLGLVESEALRVASGRDWVPADVSVLSGGFALLLLLSLLSLDPPESILTDRLRILGTAAFGIYLMHVPVLEVTGRGLYHLAPGLLGATALLYLILVTAGVGLPVAAMYLVRRSPLRRAYPILFG